MEKTTKAKLMGILGVLVAVIIIMIILQFILPGPNCCMCGNPDNDCCPCPNKELIDIVEEHTGQQASSAGSWLSLCEKYKEDTNDTRECFE